MGDLVVVKVGTSSVTTPNGSIDHDVLAALATDVASARRDGCVVVLVSSGAITAGWAALHPGTERPRDARTLQAVSAVGQPLLMDAWRTAFARVGATTGQVLFSPADFAHRTAYLHARATVHRLLELGIVPIVNENDAVTDDEIRFGDNDRLAALLANLLSATRLVLLTDTAGVFTADPHLDATATLIEEVAAFDRAVAEAAGQSASVVGSGGMAGKLAAARIAAWSGIATSIGAARRLEPLATLLARTPGTGSHLAPREGRLSARKAWIAFAAPSRGRLVLNDGAAVAITERGASVLAVGVLEVVGAFAEGDAVELVTPDGGLVAKGLVRASAAGLASAGDPVVHRDDLVLLQADERGRLR